MKLLSTAVFSICILSSSCSVEETPSNTKFAFYPAEQSYAGIAGRIETLRQGFDTNYQQLKICVGQGIGSYSNEEFLLETKLAYVMWLSATQKFSEEDWSLLKFEQRDDCDRISSRFSANVLLKNLPGERNKISPTTVTCERSFRGISCSSAAMTLGYGGPGAMQVSVLRNDRQRWISINNSYPALTVLNPFVKWESIRTNVNANQAISRSDRQQIIEEYEYVLGFEDPTYSDLLGLSAILTLYGTTGRQNNELNQFVQEFRQSNESSFTGNFEPKKAAFATIVHEVGHQMGMDHADNPDASSRSGAIEVGFDLEGNPVDSFATEQAAMAYGDPYFYLTADDQNGSRAVASEVEEFLASHK